MGGRGAAQCWQIILLLFTFLFWISGFALLGVAIWTIVDPKYNYILDLVHLSENDPLLKAAAYVMIVVGGLTLLVGFVACCASIKKMRCPLITLFLFLLIILLAEVAIGALSIAYRKKFTDESLAKYVANMSQNRYNRDYWVKPLLDTIQYYQQCCGGYGPLDYRDSFWYITNTIRGTRSYVPPSCCKQTQQARAWSIQPVDPMCTTYRYYTSAFNNSVHIEGCHRPLLNWLTSLTTLFAGIGFGFAALQLIGICIVSVLYHYVDSYYYVKGRPTARHPVYRYS